jgi:hypothetical protein
MSVNCYSYSEVKRLAHIEEHIGKTEALDFAKRTLRIYRSAVLHSKKRGVVKPHFASLPLYREKFIRSYLELKRYVGKAQTKAITVYSHID